MPPPLKHNKRHKSNHIQIDLGLIFEKPTLTYIWLMPLQCPRQYHAFKLVYLYESHNIGSLGKHFTISVYMS